MIKITGWPVMKSKCPSCPFGPNGNEDVRNSVVTRLFSASQICHHPALHGKEENRLCRGARDLQLQMLHRMGMLNNPTDECFAETSNKYLSK